MSKNGLMPKICKGLKHMNIKKTKFIIKIDKGSAQTFFKSRHRNGQQVCENNGVHH